MHYFEKP